MAKADRVPLEVIQGKVLAALDDESKVALVLDVDDLDLLVIALQHVPAYCGNVGARDRLLQGLRQLREAFDRK